MNQINNKIVVFSGKGGVGKTFLSVNIAYGLYIHGNSVGILDADITGPNVPKMIGVDGKLLMENNRIQPQEKHGVKIVSMANLLDAEQAVIWRGPMRSKLLGQFINDVDWGDLKYLIADLPPGTGDEILTMTQEMKPQIAVIVTTPQEVSLIDSARAITMAKKMKIPKIALVENMAGMSCPYCGKFIDLFGSGGGRKQAEAMNIDFLGSIPMSIKSRQLSDEGRPVILENGASEISPDIFNIVRKIEDMCNMMKVKPLFANNPIESV